MQPCLRKGVHSIAVCGKTRAMLRDGDCEQFAMDLDLLDLGGPEPVAEQDAVALVAQGAMRLV